MEDVPTCRHIVRLAARGLYVAADDAQRLNREAKKRHIAALRRQLEEDQATQWLAFHRAEKQYEEMEAAELTEQQQRQATTLESRLEEVRQTHDEDLEAFVTREETVLMRRPVPHTYHYIETKRAEKQLALQGRYRAAETLRQQAAHLATLECRTAASDNQRRLKEKIAKWEQDYTAKETNTLHKLHAKNLLDNARAQRHAEATHIRIARMQTNMAAMHERQYRELDTLGHTRGGFGAPLCTATRGTRLERRVITEHQTLPSLCEMYVHFLV